MSYGRPLPSPISARPGGGNLTGAARDAVAALAAAARQQWPSIKLPDSDFISAVSQHVPADADATAIKALHGTDLFLACACARGDDAALIAFEHAYGADIKAMLRRVRAPADLLDETHQRLRAHLFVAEPGTEPRIAEYAGRGPLRGFLRVVAVRLALQLMRKDARTRIADDADLWNVPDDQDDPELQYLKDLYRHEFKSAFEHALSELSPRDRTLLRYHLVDRLTIDQLAALDGTPRSTAGRHLAAARNRLVQATQLALAARLNIEEDEMRSVLRLVRSSVDVSVNRLLA